MNEATYYTSASTGQLGVIASNIPPHTIQVHAKDGKEVMRVEREGRIFWNGREVETDDDFRGAMMELRNALMGSMQ